MLGEDGRPILDALVLGGPDLHVMFAHLNAADGAGVGADGGFEIHAAAGAPLHLLAITPRAWSAVTVIAAGDGDATAELRIGRPAAMRGAVRYGGQLEVANVFLRTGVGRGVTLSTQTVDGRYLIAPVPPGTWDVSVALATDIGGGSSQAQRSQVTISAGQTLEQDFALAVGVTLVLVPRPPSGTPMEQAEGFLLAGTDVPADAGSAKQRLRQRQPGDDSFMYGGVDADRPLEFHDRPPGPYVACLAVGDGRQRSWGCRAVVLRIEAPVQELEIETGPLAPRVR